MRKVLLAVAFVAALANPLPAQAHTRTGMPTNSPIARRIMEVFGPNAGPRAVRIAWCESKFNPHAVSRTDDVGLLQLHSPGTLKALGITWQEALNPEINIQAAHRLYLQQGFSPWVCKG